MNVGWELINVGFPLSIFSFQNKAIYDKFLSVRVPCFPFFL